MICNLFNVINVQCNQLVIGPSKWATLFYPFFGTFFGDVDSSENVTCVLYDLRYVNDLGKLICSRVFLKMSKSGV